MGNTESNPGRTKKRTTVNIAHNSVQVKIPNGLTFTERLVLLLYALDQEPMRHQRYVLMEIVDGDGNVTTAAAQLDVCVSGQHKVEAQIGDRAAIQVERFNLICNK